MIQRFWLLKSEPQVFSFNDLWTSKGRVTPWDGIRNYQARNRMRDDMQVGDGVLYYHSNCPTPGVAGVAEIASEPYPDATQFDPESKYFDPKSTRKAPRWTLVDVRATARVERLVPLTELREDPLLMDLELLRRGNRLSVQGVGRAEWTHILALAGVSKASQRRIRARKA